MSEFVPYTPKPEDMEVTPERALMIKKALIRQWEDQNNVVVLDWKETPRATSPA